MKKHIYPAVFLKEDVGYSVSFPGIDGCYTQGDTLEEAYEMAKEALGLYFSSSDNIFVYPTPTNIEDVVTGDNEHLALIEFDEVEYLKKFDNRAVKKTLTIPAYINTEAEKKGINFSEVLKEALIAKLS